eukprot:Em0020g766a
MAPISIGQLVHTYPVGTWNSSESASKCIATHKNGTHLHWYTPTLWVHGTAKNVPQSALQLTRMAPISIGQLVHTYPVGTWNSSESAPKCFATHKNGTHLHCVPNPRVTLGPWLAQVHTYPVGTWNSSESAPKCFATHKNGTHFHCVLDPRVTLSPWLVQVHTYPVGTWNSSESAPKCFATHKNGTHLHWYTPTLWVHGTASESAPKCLATHKNGTHPHWYTPTLWVHGTAQSLPQSVLQLTRMAPISIGQLVHTYPVGTWNSSESASKYFATHKNGTHLHWSASQSLPQSALQLTRMAPISIGQLVHTYPVGTWNSSESAPKCFATHKNGTHLHWYTTTLWVHGTAQSLPQSDLQLTRMAPISIGQLVHTYPVGTWNSSESAPKCFATHKNGTHLHWYTPTLWVHGTAQSLPQSVLQLTRMAPISIGQLVHTYPVGTRNSSESAPKCFATHKNGTHLHCVLDPRVTLGPWLAQVHIYPVGTWNSSESAPKCFATHKNGTHLHCVPNPRVTLGPRLAQVHTYPVDTWNSSESAPKCFATHKNGTHLHWSACTHLPCGYMQQLRVCPKVLCNSQEWHPSPLVSFVLDPRVTLGPQLAQVHTYPVGTWNSSESASKSFATHENGTHLHWYTPTLWVHATAQSLPQSALQLTRMAPISIGQLVHTYPVGTWNSSESASKSFATHENGTHLHCVPDPCVTLGTWLAQVHTYPVGGYMEQLTMIRHVSDQHQMQYSSAAIRWHECVPSLTPEEERQAAELLKRAISTSPDKGVVQLATGGAPMAFMQVTKAKQQTTAGSDALKCREYKVLSMEKHLPSSKQKFSPSVMKSDNVCWLAIAASHHPLSGSAQIRLSFLNENERLIPGMKGLYQPVKVDSKAIQEFIAFYHIPKQQSPFKCISWRIMQYSTWANTYHAGFGLLGEQGG